MGDMSIKISEKINNLDTFKNECLSRMSTYSMSDKKIKLLISTSIIIETAMLYAYEMTGRDNTGAICKLYNDGVLCSDYQPITTNIRSMRNDLVHMNIGYNDSIENLQLTLSECTTKKFNKYIKDLFGKYNIFTDNEIRDLLEMLAEPLGIDVFKNDTDEMFVG